jgi:hypothetical protein
MRDSSQTPAGLNLGFQDNRREKLFDIRNKLSRHPGDLKIIEEYVDLLLKATGDAGVTGKLEAYDRIEAFLFERTEEVGPDEVDDLLEIASDIDERREEVLGQSESVEEESRHDQKVIDTHEEWKENRVDNTIPLDPKEAERKFSLCKKVRSLIRDQNREMIEGLPELIDQLQSATGADELFQRFDRIIESVTADIGSPEATYLLQSAEQTVSQLVTRRDDLDESRSSKIESKLRELEDLSSRVSKKRQEAKDQRRWREFLDKCGEELEELEAWDIYGDWYRFRDVSLAVPDEDGGTTLSIAKTKKEPRNNSPFTTKIKQLEEMLQSLSQVAEGMRTEVGLEQVEPKIEAIDVKLEHTRERRGQTYNEFAMARIRKCLSEAEDATGTWSDKEEIARQLVKYLAEVDQRYLTSEVGRCYSEAFEYLYGKLKRAKSKDDFEEEGRKLNVLKRMQEKEAIGIDAF